MDHLYLLSQEVRSSDGQQQLAAGLRISQHSSS
jgi:hypothetical protein